MAAEAGHAANRAYFDQAGNLHINGASVFDAGENDLAAGVGSQIHNVALTNLKKVAAVSAGLPATDDGTSPGLVNGTYLTSNPVVQTGDLKTLNTTRTARFQFAVPRDYVAGGAITLRLNAGMVTTVADTAATIAVNCVRTAAPTTDINATTAISINSLTAADCNFTITPTNVVAGDLLDVKITLAVNDGASGTAVIAALNSIKFLLTQKF
jgi:hypothetical protein